MYDNSFNVCHKYIEMFLNHIIVTNIMRNNFALIIENAAHISRKGCRILGKKTLHKLEGNGGG